MLIKKLALINKVGFAVLLTVAGVWLVSMTLIPEWVEVINSTQRVTYEEQLQSTQLEDSAPATQSEF